MKNGKIFGIILLTANVFFAQVNTEKYRTPKEELGLSGYLELNGTIKTGNTEKTEAGIDGRLNWKTINSTTFLVFESDYEWVNGKRSSDEGLLHVRHVRNLINRLSAEFFGQINYDKKLLIENRELAGGGLRYKLFDFENSDIAIGTSYMFEHENYDLTESAEHPAEVKVSRWSNYLSFYLQFNSSVTFGGVVYYQPMFSDFTDYRLLSENSLMIGITKILSLSVNFKVRHDYIPPNGIKQTDTETNFGIAVRF